MCCTKIFSRIFIFFIIPLFISGCKWFVKKELVSKSVNRYEVQIPEKQSEISMIFIGDIMEHDLQIESAYNPKQNKYDFSTQFQYLKPLFQKTDVVIANFEVTLSGAPYKGYPKFSSPNQLAVAVKEAGINYLVLANNHINDGEKKGFDRTLKIIDSLGFVRTGAFYNQTDKQKNNPMIIEKNGFKIAVFNYTYGYNNDVHLKENIINIIDKNEIIKDLKEIEGNKFDAKIVFFHWGNEYERLPDTVQQDLAAFCFDNGFDIIIGSHPHVIQPMQFIDYQLPDGTKKKVFIAYSLGNYVSNYGVWRYCDGGALVQLNLVKKNNKVEIVAPKYHLIWVYRPIRQGKLRNYFVVPITEFENNTSIGTEHYNLMQTFINDSRLHLNTNNINVPEAK